jgi:hypothetical protein
MEIPMNADHTFTAADDGFHFNQMSDRWWETETAWFSFVVPERRLSGWVYVYARPNVGSVAGGAWVWDDSAHLPWDVLYNANYTVLRLPKARDLTDITLPTGVSVRMIEPLQRYAVGFNDGDRISLALEFDAIMPPMPLKAKESAFLGLNHWDQIGRVTGELILHGERILVDCFAMRDRSWGPRPEHRAKRSTYVTGMVSAREGFLAMTGAGGDRMPLTHGFLLRDGIASHLIDGVRTTTRRSSSDGWTETLTIEAKDELGRTLHATGEAVSRMVINRHSFIDMCSMVRWSVDGREGWGEDQDLWPIHEWADFRRSGRAAAIR